MWAWIITVLLAVFTSAAWAAPNTTQPNAVGMVLSPCAAYSFLVAPGSGSSIACSSVATGGNTNLTISAGVQMQVTTAAFTTSRTWTLPLSTNYGDGSYLYIADLAGAISGTDTLVIAAQGSDTVNGAASITVGAQYGIWQLVTDGNGHWILPTAASGAITSANIVNGTGLSETGTCNSTSLISCTLSLTNTSTTVAGKTCALGGSCTIATANLSDAASAGTNTVPVVTGSDTVTYEAVPNTALAHSSLTYNGATLSLGSSYTFANNNGSYGNPSAITGTGSKMLGLGSSSANAAATLTPTVTGDVLVIVSGNITTASTNQATYQISYGTGAAPSNGAAETGTQVCLAPNMTNTSPTPFSISCFVTGLTLSTAYWFDLAVSSGSSSNSTTLLHVGTVLHEL